MGKQLTRLAFALATIPLAGYVLSVLWGWFIVPLGVARLGIAQALGLQTLVNMLLSNVSRSDNDDSAKRLLALLLVPVFALAFGWIEHLFMMH